MKQLSFKTLGGDTVSYPIRGKNYIVKRGYAAPPGTGPAGETCKTCRFRVRFRRWNKCGLAQGKWTGGPGSDILASAQACRYWEKFVSETRSLIGSRVLTSAEVLQKLMAKP